ncbi:MAG: alanine racemase [candidate division KSB1 bacterium]|nr:alanine racemase [candidate division KSB1 bacterium]
MDFQLYNKTYSIEAPEKIKTPRLILFSDRVQTNIDRMQHSLVDVHPFLGLKHLCPHVKTHKSVRIVRQLVRRGVTSFKATPHELPLLIDAEISSIFLSYPCLPDTAHELTKLIRSYPNIDFRVQVGCRKHVDILRMAGEGKVQWNYYIDMDVGMHRTGVAPWDVWDLYVYTSNWSSMKFMGFHAYDGHIHSKDPEEREQMCRTSMKIVEQTLQFFSQNNVHVPEFITGGTPSFLHAARYVNNSSMANVQVKYSPGTWVLSDSETMEILPDQFEPAALILSRIIDKPTPNTLTLNVGHKEWSADRGPVDVFSVPDVRAVIWNEEHTVLEGDNAEDYEIGDYVLLVPRHICSTVNLWEFYTVVDGSGTIIQEISMVDGRNR